MWLMLFYLQDREHQFRLEPLYILWLLCSMCICTVLLCSSGSLGNMKSVLCLSSWLFLSSNFSLSLNNIPDRVLSCI